MTKWHLLPGMGANSSMYNALRPGLQFDASFTDWPQYKGEKTFAEIVKRIVEENGIRDGDIVGGTSLGGMVALEIAGQIKPAAVVLISSATDRREVRSIPTFLARISNVVPLKFFQSIAGGFNNPLMQMFARSDPDFMRKMSLYLLKWPGGKNTGRPTFRIHGNKDCVIACPNADCEVIEGAGHLLAITHALQCGEFLNRINRQLTDLQDLLQNPKMRPQS